MYFFFAPNSHQRVNDKKNIKPSVISESVIQVSIFELVVSDKQTMVNLLLLLLFVTHSMAGVCPPPGKISPCSCSDLGNEGLVVQLNCVASNLDDSRASEILNTMISWPRVSPLRLLDFSRNLLTRIPKQLTQFDMLNSIALDNNQISTIESGAFNFSSETLTRLSLSSNPITTIQEGAFQGILKII